MMKYTSKSEYILGIAISARTVQAALVHDAPSGPSIIRTFSRKRAGIEPLDSVMPEVHDEVDADVAFSVPSVAAMDPSLFLASEFGASEVPAEGGINENMVTAQLAMPCDMEIQDIVAECADAGYEKVHIVFAIATDYASALPINIEDGVQGNKGKKGKSAKNTTKEKDQLLAALEAIHSLTVNPEKVVFLPLSELGVRNETHLAVVVHPNEPVSISLKAIRDRKRPFPNVSLLDTEITLLLGLARASLLTDRIFEESSTSELGDSQIEEEEITVIVRIGVEDTLVIFMTGRELTHYESLRSITSFDPSDTICSRILMMHDEFGAGDADRMLLFCDVEEDSVFERLSEVFPDTYIDRLRNVLPQMQEERGTPIGIEGIVAAAVALRVVRDELWQSVFPETNFLPSKLRKGRLRLPFSWPVAAMILMLFGTTLFFVHRYFVMSHEIEMARYELKNFPEDMIGLDVDVLQTKIDSLRSRSAGFLEALDLLDSLLVGSDVWSRALERTSVHTGDISGLWIERWEEKMPGVLSITGTSMDRDQIVKFAARASANIESIRFSEIRDWPVYLFQLTIHLERTLPEAAIYLRENAAIQPDVFSAVVQENLGTGPGK